MKAGETVRCKCSECETEFTVCLEPGRDPQRVVNFVDYCPFCGEQFDDESTLQECG